MNHPYGIPIIGWRHEIETLTLQDALDFYATYYAPNNATLIVAGDVDPAQVEALAREHYGPIAPTPGLTERVRPSEPPQLAPRHLAFADERVSNPYVIRSYLAPERDAGDQEEAAALSILAAVLGGSSATSVMGRTLEQEEGVALYTAAFYSGTRYDDTTFSLIVMPVPGRTLEQAEADMDRMIQRVLTDGIDPAQLERIRTQVRASDVYDRDSLQGRAREVGVALTSGLTVQDVLDWPDILSAVTEEDIVAAAERLFDPRRSVTGYLDRPAETGDIPAAGCRRPRTGRPAGRARCDGDRPMMRPGTRLMPAVCAALLAPLPAVAAVEIQEVTSPGGITAWLVEEHSIPFTAIEVQFDGGANGDAPVARGATNMMMGLLEEGAGDMDARAFAEARETIAARFGFDASSDSVTVSLSFLTEFRDESVDLMRTALTDPRFDPDAVERVREQILAGLASDARDPGEIASRTFAALSFAGHPYGSAMEGTESTVAALSIADLKAAHARALTLDRVHVGVTGDITAEQLGPLLDELLGDLPRDAGPAVPDVETALGGGVTVIDYPSPQSLVVFGQEGIAFEDPDYYAAFVLNHVLGGGGFDSRLMTEVREERGLTYGIGTYLAARDKTAQLLGQFSSSNGTTAEAIALIRDEWSRIAADGITQAELDRAVTFLTGAYPLRFDGNARIAGILTGMQSIGLPIDYIPNRNAMIEAVTAEDVARVAARLLRPEALHFVVVGQPEGLETGAF